MGKTSSSPYTDTCEPSILGYQVSLATPLTSPLNSFGDECSLKIYSIDPMHRTSEFVLLHEQILPGSGLSPHIYLNEPVIVVKAACYIYVWNWVERTGCRWVYTTLDYNSNVSGSTLYTSCQCQLYPSSLADPSLRKHHCRDR